METDPDPAKEGINQKKSVSDQKRQQQQPRRLRLTEPIPPWL